MKMRNKRQIHPTVWQKIKCFLGFHKWQFWREGEEEDKAGQMVIKFCENCLKEKRIDPAIWLFD